MDAPAAFSRWLRQLRTAQDLTQEELAERMGCSPETIRAFEGERRRPSRAMTERLAEVLDVPPDQRAAFVRAGRAVVLPEPAASSRAALASPLAAVSLEGPRQQRRPLPLPSSLLIGREAERRALRAQLAAGRLVTLVGPGGIGKTRLALQVAADLAQELADGAAFVALAPVAGAAHVAAVLAEALGLSLPGTGAAEAQLLGFLRERELLLVLDNLEHLLTTEHGDRISTLLAEILRAAPGVRLLVTSRERLRLRDERVVELGGLILPDDRAVNVERADAVLLFLERARQTVGDFAITADNRAAVARICHLLDGAPLAIELAAAWVRALTCGEIAAEVARGLDFLELSERDADPRHRSMRAVIDHSWQLLSRSEAQALARLSVFRGGCRREAAAAVAGASLPILVALIDKSLLRHTAAGRYELHELVRQYAAARLRDAAPDAEPAWEHAHQAHARYFLGLARAAQEKIHGPEQIEWLDRLDQEHDNLRAALDWALAQQEVDLSAGLVGALYEFWFVRGHHREGRERLARLLGQLGPQERTPARAIALLAAGFFGLIQGDYAGAQPALEATLSIHRELADKPHTARALLLLGLVSLGEKRLDAAQTALEESLALSRAADDKRSIGLALSPLGDIAMYRGAYELAQTYYQESADLLRAVYDKNQLAVPIRRLGQVALRRGNYPQAIAHFHESLRHNLEVGDQRGVAACLAGLAGVATAQGHGPRAAQLFAAMDVLLSDVADLLMPADVADYEHSMAALRMQLSEAELARACAEGRALMHDALKSPQGPGAFAHTILPPSALVEPLTERERDVLRLLAAGRSNQQIAAELVLAVGTVKRHVNSLLGKLDVTSRLAAVARARELNLIS